MLLTPSACLVRMERAKTLAEELFVLQVMGDDRAIAEVYVNGSPCKSGVPDGAALAENADISSVFPIY